MSPEELQFATQILKACVSSMSQESKVLQNLDDPSKVKKKIKGFTSPEELKQARQELAKYAKCSLQAEPPEVQDQMKKHFLEDMLDYKPGEKTLDGQKLDPDGTPQPIFHSKFFKIKNTERFETTFHETSQQLQQTCTDPKCYTPMELVHGCPTGSAGSILGISGGWFTKGEYVSAGLALGPGAYFGEKIRKSLGYIGDTKRGSIILSTVMRGENYQPLKHQDDHLYYTDKTSLSVVGSWHNWEICVKDNKYILPHHIVEVEQGRKD